MDLAMSRLEVLPVASLRRCLAWALWFCLLAGCASQTRPAQLLSGAEPVYPPGARQAGIQGQVVIRYDLTAEGAVVNVQVVAAQPPGVFEEAALAAIAQWRFRPALAQGRSIASQGRISTLRFRMGGGEKYAGR